MELYRIIFISLQILITNVVSKKYASSSEESIENLLYFKDCQKKNEAPSTPPPFEKLKAAPKPKAMDCPFPKMCCSITCDGGSECGGSTSPFVNSHNMGAEQIMPMNSPLQPHMQPPIGRTRKKKGNQPMRLPLPMGGRRNFGFTKDRIKSLINQDDDIRKILKDLVRVTMQKVDLVGMINTKKGLSPAPPKANLKYNANEYDDEDDLE